MTKHSGAFPALRPRVIPFGEEELQFPADVLFGIRCVDCIGTDRRAKVGPDRAGRRLARVGDTDKLTDPATDLFSLQSDSNQRPRCDELHEPGEKLFASMDRVEPFGLGSVQSTHDKTGNNEAGRFQPAKYLADAMLSDRVRLDQQKRLVQVQGFRQGASLAVAKRRVNEAGGSVS